MSEQQPELLDGTFVRIVHPVTGGTAAIPRSALGAHYAGGWQLVPEDPPAGAGPPVTTAPVAAGRGAASKPASKGKE